MPHAMSFENANGEWAIANIEEVSAEDIGREDNRIFVARESNVDWLVEAIEAHLNREGGR